MSRVPGDSPAADVRPEFDSRPGTEDESSHLRDRLERLPPGHPSSPYEADGSRRESTARLRDLDLPGPYSDAEWSDHREAVRVRLADANRDGLSTEVQCGVDEDGEAWVASRRALHGAIIDDIYARAANVPCEYRAIVAGGMPGAGKTTVLEGHAGIDRSQYLTINPDDIKEELAKRDLIPMVEGLSPMEASDLVHEESSHLAKQLAIRARGDGKNIIWDIIMSSSPTTERRIDDLRGSGYASVAGIFVDIPVDVSVVRAEARHRHDEDLYRTGKGLGGRYVPEEYITSRADEEWGSKNHRTFEALKSRFDGWTIFDNGVDGRDPIRVGTGSPDYDEETRS